MNRFYKYYSKSVSTILMVSYLFAFSIVAYHFHSIEICYHGKTEVRSEKPSDNNVSSIEACPIYTNAPSFNASEIVDGAAFAINFHSDQLSYIYTSVTKSSQILSLKLRAPPLV
ncbi:MAG: hypothetical protein K9J12_16620 [Melioribacteraceae bacterium]|nr:hypothetical protein [Melioribacteraceae bacterium]MCF8412436.1 hypothetical protein [Melioribacteraceae bacterium]MCF8430811.1 hypothetical protein [Melioribacteraceae bacterium]